MLELPPSKWGSNLHLRIGTVEGMYLLQEYLKVPEPSKPVRHVYCSFECFGENQCDV